MAIGLGMASPPAQEASPAAAMSEVQYRGLSAAAFEAATAAAIPRPVIVEEFTAEWCTYCYAVGIALERIEAATPREELIVMGHHNADLLVLPFSDSRFTNFNITGLPTVHIDGLIPAAVRGGHSVSEGEPGIQASYNDLTALIAQEKTRIAATAPFQVTVSGEMQTTNPAWRVTITSITGYPRTVRVHSLITEDHIPYAASNGQTEFSFVARAYLGGHNVTLAAPGTAEFDVAYSGTVTSHDPAQLHPVVFVEDQTTKELLGGSGVFAAQAAVSDWELYE